MAKGKKVCSHCGASMVEYRHTFSEGLAIGLRRLYDVSGPINLRELHLTRDQWDNFQKLQYWGLVRKALNENGDREGLGGCWEITELGRVFVYGAVSILKHVYTYRGITQRQEGDKINFADVHPGYKQRPEYAAEAVAHQEVS